MEQFIKSFLQKLMGLGKEKSVLFFSFSLFCSNGCELQNTRLRIFSIQMPKITIKS